MTHQESMPQMSDFSQHFQSFDQNIWLNAASEGPLPIIADQALQEVIVWKSKPYLLTLSRFVETQVKLKIAIAKLLNVQAEDVILANSASYGIHLLANGLPWSSGDEILLMQNDFPTDILPWLALKRNGIDVKQVKADNHILTPNEVEQNITSKTKLVCLPHVHTFSGRMLDVTSIAEICRKNGIIFVLNIAQSLGTMPIDLEQIKADAVVGAGYKWLCGPYGTGICWMKKEIREQLTINLAYWSALMKEEDLLHEDILQLSDQKTSRKYDVFGTANFFNFIPLTASINFLMDLGLENVHDHHQKLADVLINGLDRSKYELISLESGLNRSSLIVFAHKLKERNAQIVAELKALGIYVALWKNRIRVSSHIYNSQQDIERLLKNLP